MPDCPAIRLIIPPNANVATGIPQQLRSLPHSVVQAEPTGGQAFESAFLGVNIVFHDGPVIHPQEEATSIAVIDAAKAAGVHHFILCSVFQSIRVKLRTHQTKLRLVLLSTIISISNVVRIEEYLVESRVNYTILQVINTHPDPLSNPLTIF